VLSIEMDPFRIGDLVKYVYYDWDSPQIGAPRIPAAERSNLAFIVDIIEDPDEKQIDLFPKVLIYDTQLQRMVLTHSYNVEFISRAQ
jgi:hypothetical protein